MTNTHSLLMPPAPPPPPAGQTPRGFALISYWADDVGAAAAWYAELLGVAPYFERALPGEASAVYIEFRFGDYQQELGLVDRRFAPPGSAAGPGGVVVYWHVDDVPGTFARLLAMGATALEGPQDRGRGFVTASVLDPFGNVLGVMYNPQYVAVRGARSPGAPA
jgi:predicted enzyme related to lactoylglutathione lyase